jgi:hypothetical protein
MENPMKSIISALALLLLATPAFADTTIDITSVEVNEVKPNGNPWDLNVPKTQKHLPELIVEVIVDSKSALETPMQTDALSATFEGQSFSMKQGSSVIFKVWDKDLLMKKDLIAEIPFTLADQNGEITLTNSGVKALKINVKAPAKTAPAEAPAAEAPAAEAPAAEAPAAEAPAAEAPAAEAPAAE